MIYSSLESGTAIFELAPSEHAAFKAFKAVNKITADAHGEYTITVKMTRTKFPFVCTSRDTADERIIYGKSIKDAVKREFGDPIQRYHGYDRKLGQRIELPDGRRFAIKRKI